MLEWWSRRRVTGGSCDAGRDAAKDQSYVLYMLGQAQLARLRLPVGEMTKDRVRGVADELGLRTAAKPDSQDVCFISKDAGRNGFLSARMPVTGGRLVTTAGDDIGPVQALELLTIGQRRGLGLLPRSRPERRYVVDVDLTGRTATVGDLEALLVDRTEVADLSWSRGVPVPAGDHCRSAVERAREAVGGDLGGWRGGGQGGRIRGADEAGSTWSGGCPVRPRGRRRGRSAGRGHGRLIAGRRAR